MVCGKIFQLVAAIFGLIGGIILAYSLNGLLSEIKLALNLLGTFIQSFVSQGNIFTFDGIDKRLNDAGIYLNIGFEQGFSA